MKKILAFIMSMVFVFSALSISVSAEEISDNTVVVTCGQTDFIFASDISADIQNRFITHYFAEDDDSAAYGLTCTLFGHDLETTTVTTITHKVRTSDPRCLKELYQVETCSRCDYTNSTVISNTYISCC